MFMKGNIYCSYFKFEIDSFYYVYSNGDDFVQAVKQHCCLKYCKWVIMTNEVNLWIVAVNIIILVNVPKSQLAAIFCIAST